MAADGKGRQGKAVQVYLSDDLAAQVEALAGANGRSLSNEIRHAIERHLAAPPQLVTPPLATASEEKKPRGRPRKGER